VGILVIGLGTFIYNEIQSIYMSVEENTDLMKTLDDAWNSQAWDIFSKLPAEDVIVRWPAQPPTQGIAAHRKEGEYLFKTFPDNHVGNDPYKVFFDHGDWTCSRAGFTGTHNGRMTAYKRKNELITRSFKLLFP
jgi:SnoaL-like polyketide cyclase